jgi:hypothetical protein
MNTFDDDDFVDERANRKRQVNNRRKHNKGDKRDGERKVHRVEKSKERWRFDPKQKYSDDED